ncbi:MAG: 3-Hydroxypropionyl-CoA dehydratase [Acidimicrobiaceae bacterium]|nr:3-Hydroxypropionyl-CoA dehydratase [Acidimicrobiaceae bacterium]
MRRPPMPSDSGGDDGDPASGVVRYRVEDGIAFITLNRPDKLNALNPAVFSKLDDFITEFNDDHDAAVAIVHGNGRAFAAGADIEHYVDISVPEYLEFMRYGNRVQEKFVTSTKPVLAAVHGYALGGGFELALSCDLIVVDPEAQLGLPEARLGLLPGGGGTQRLPRLIGATRTLELLITGGRFSGRQAVDWGLALGLGEEQSVLEAAKRLAHRIVRQAPLAVQLAKVLVRSAFDSPLASALAFEQAVGAMLFSTEDAREGIAAFVDKRVPRFQGR